MAKNLSWDKDFATGTIQVSSKSTYEYDAAKKFRFIVTRKKDSKTLKETLHIKCENDINGTWASNGDIDTDIMNLGTKLKSFMEYGVVLSPTIFADLRSEIEKDYLQFQVEIISDSNNSNRINLTDIMKLIKECVKDSELKGNDKGYCDIKIKYFNEIFNEPDMKHIDPLEVRKKLADAQYIEHGEGRTSYLVRTENSVERVIRFKADVLK